MRLGRVLLSALKNHGAGAIFGIPGDFTLPFFKVIEESGILSLYPLSHEHGDDSCSHKSRLGESVSANGSGDARASKRPP
jgi:indolepyruvate decarboxylase